MWLQDFTKEIIDAFKAAMYIVYTLTLHHVITG